MIRIKNLHKRFGKLTVLDDLFLDFGEKGIHVILGPNGSGKTTLIKCILGMVIPNKGSIEINDRMILGDWEYRKYLAYMPQIANFPKNLTVQELFNMIEDLRGTSDNLKRLIKEFAMEPFLQKRLGNLSGGTTQKVNIIITFMFDSPLLILDEPTSGLDPVAMINLKKLIFEEKEKGKTILISTHIMGLVEEISDEIIFLLEGKIYFQGTVEELLNQTTKKSLESSIADILRKTNA